MAEISLDPFYISILQLNLTREREERREDRGEKREEKGERVIRFDREETYLKIFSPLVEMEAKAVVESVVRERHR